MLYVPAVRGTTVVELSRQVMLFSYAVCSIGNSRFATGDQAVCTCCLWHKSCGIIIAGNVVFICCL